MAILDLVDSDRADADARLLERIVARDSDALGDLYDRYGRIVFGVLYRMLADPQAAEEVTQDAFHAVWRQGATYRRERGAVRTWLLAIARNAAIDWRRTKGKRLEREVIIDEAFALEGAERVDDRVIADLAAERVRLAVATLPADQRDALTLSFWGGYSQSEIAARIGAPLGTVKGRFRLGMAKLRERLAEGNDS